jgi:ribosomal protein L37AE/L43A
MSEPEAVRRVCPICGAVRVDVIGRTGLRKVWTCFHCNRTFSPPKSRDSVFLKLKALFASKNDTEPWLR